MVSQKSLGTRGEYAQTDPTQYLELDAPGVNPGDIGLALAAGPSSA